MAIEVNATPRATQGKGASRRLRHEERVPGILYGGGKPAQNIELDHKELALQPQAGGLSRLDPDA